VHSPAIIRLRARLRIEGPQVIRIVVAAFVSWALCRAMGSTHPPVYAVLVPLVALRDDPYSAFNVSFDRLLGVVGGICIGIATARWLGSSAYAVALMLAVGLFGGIVLRKGTTLNIQMGISGLLVFANPDPTSYALARLWETAVGAGVTVVLSAVLLPPNPRRRFLAQLDDVAAQITTQLSHCAALLGTPGADHAELDELRRRGHQMQTLALALPGTLSTARRAIAHNPLRRADRPRLAELEPIAARASQLGESVRLLLDEVSDLSARPDLALVWPKLAATMATTLQPIISAVRPALTPAATFAAAPTDLDAELEAGVAAFQDWRANDPQPVAAVLRRPVRHLLSALGHDPGDPAHPTQIAADSQPAG
jgi:Aromatic acid exporter family member 1